jgi:hypothetical protein
MKRFILYSLSATFGLAMGAVAHADMHNSASEANEDLTEGVISPDSQSPNNRAIPGTGADSESPVDSTEDLTDGIISPDSESPNNRAVPGEGVLDAEPQETNPDLTDGIISPDSESPNNRVVPGNGMSDDMRTFEEAYQIYQETGEFSLYDDAESSPTDGIISPDSSSPNNRVIPGEGALESDDAMMDSPADGAPTDGIISPDSTSPDNRVEVDREPNVTDGPMDSEDLNETDGIIVPDSDSPNNREVPGTAQ